MKKILISAIVVVAFVGYFWFQQQSQSSVDITPSISATPNPTSTGTSSPINTPTATSQASGFKDGTYTSAVTDARYGSVQIKVIVQSGKMTDIQWLQYPTAAGHTKDVSAYSTPILKQEALTAQSASIDIVSGATETSQAFIQALGDVLVGIKA